MPWEAEYSRKLGTADEALSCVASDMRGYIQPGCAEPETLVEALIRRAPAVRNVGIVHMMTMGCAPYVAPPMAGHFRHNAVFIGSNVREAINDGRADYTPIYLSEIEELFESGAMPIDVALVELSPPDSQGYCSFGVGVDTTLTATKCARHVVAQINSYMSRTFGDSFIHISDIDAMVESSRPLCEPLMKAEFSIYPITATETHLDFRGHYEPPLGVMGKTVDAVAGCRVAEVAVHGFLSDVAAYLRQTLTSEPSRLH